MIGPIVGPVLSESQGQYDAGNYAGAAGTLARFVGGAGAPEAAFNGIKMLPGYAKAAVVGDVTKPIPGTTVSPLQRFNSAKNMGGQLDAADATNSRALGQLTDPAQLQGTV